MNTYSRSVAGLQKLFAAMALFAMVFSPLVNVQFAEAQTVNDHQIRICHATGGDNVTQPTPTKAQIVADINDTNPNGQAHGSLVNGVHPDDIVPAFPAGSAGQGNGQSWDSYPGKNWDAAGQAIWNNGCQTPPETGSITIVKSASGEGGATTAFEFSIDIEDPNFFVDGDKSDSETIDDLEEDQYIITEVNIPSGWSFDSASCSGYDKSTWETSGNTGVLVDLAEGEDVLCTFYNSLDAVDVCTDDAALNTGGPLPCEYEPKLCMDDGAINVGKPLPCEYPEDEVVIVAHKIVCTDESELPNWGAGGPDITPTTAQIWVTENDSCDFADGWEFEWGPQSVTNPDDNLPGSPYYGEAGAGWTKFGPTVNGKAVTTLSTELVGDNSHLWFREVLKDGYIPFTFGPNHKLNDNDYTAEVYCESDVKNYDNYDRIDGITLGETYECVAWNYIKPVLGCTDETAINYNPKATPGNDDAEKCEYPEPVCEIGDNLLKNGSFEEDTVIAHNGNWEIFSSVTDWAISLSDGLELWANGFYGGASDGNQNAELDGNSPTQITQPVVTIPGATYELRFDFSARPSHDSSADNSIDALADGNLVMNVTADGTDIPENTWTTHSETFVAEDASTDISFSDKGTDNSLGSLMDNAVLCLVDVPEPYCGDGYVNQWEQCEIGEEGCTDYCMFDNQCLYDQFVKITMDEQAPGSESFDGSIHLGSDTNEIPNGTWFKFDESGDDTAQSVAASSAGLGVERTSTGLRLAVEGGNSSNGFDYAFGTIEVLGLDMGALDRNPIANWPLENSGSYVDVFDVTNNSLDFKFWLTTGDDAAEVALSASKDPYGDCPTECHSSIEARIVLQDDQDVTNGGLGNLDEKVFLGDGTNVSFGDWFEVYDGSDFTNDAVTVEDFATPKDLDGLFVSREGNGDVKVALYGYHNPGGDVNYESLRATLEFRHADIVSGSAVELPDNYKIENHSETDGVNSNDNFDSFTEAGDLSGVDFDMWVDTKADGFKVTVDIETVDPCDTPNPEKLTCGDITFVSDDYSVDKNQDFTLSWDATHEEIDWVEVSSFVGPYGLVGSETTSITSDTTFTLTAYADNEVSEKLLECPVDINVNSGGGGGGSSSPKCDAFEIDGNVLSWETKRGYDLEITQDGEVIHTETDDDKVDEGEFTLEELPLVGEEFELIVNRGSRDDTCSFTIPGDGEVAGEAIEIPVGAPDTGAGGTSEVIPSLPSLLAVLSGMRRKNG